MNQIKFEAMEKQLQELKKETLRLKQILLLLLVIPFVVVLAGFQAGDRDQVVEATQFVLRDKNKKIQAKLFVTADGLPTLGFYDKNDKCRMEAGIFASDVGLVIRGETGVAHVSLTSSPGSSFFYMEEPGGKMIHLLTSDVKPDHSAVFAMGDSEGRDEFEIRAGPGWSRIDFLGEPIEKNGGGVGARNLRLVSDDKGESDIIMFDRKDKERFKISGDANGKASIIILDDNHKKILTIPNP